MKEDKRRSCARGRVREKKETSCCLFKPRRELLPWIICKYIYFDFVRNARFYFVSLLPRATIELALVNVSLSLFTREQLFRIGADRDSSLGL